DRGPEQKGRRSALAGADRNAGPLTPHAQPREMTMADATLLEQYKALIGDVGNIGARYATANGFYLSIVSALLGVVAFTESGKPLAQVDLVLVLTVAALAVVVCHVWMKTLIFYRGLLGVVLQLPGGMATELALSAFS